MPNGMRALPARLVHYWTWWRSALVLATALCAAVAAATDRPALGAVAAVAAVVPLAVLLALTGDRVATLHRLVVGPSAPGTAGPSDDGVARPDMVDERDRALVSDVAAAMAAAHGGLTRFGRVPTPEDLSVLVAADSDEPTAVERTAALVSALGAALPSAELYVVVVGRSERAIATVAGPVTEAMTDLPNLVLAPHLVDHANELDDWFDVHGPQAAGRWLLPVEIGGGSDPVVDDIVALAYAAPATTTRWVGVRRLSPTGPMLWSRSAHAEIGGRRATAAPEPLGRRLVLAGYLIDEPVPALPTPVPVPASATGTTPRRPVRTALSADQAAAALRGRVVMAPMAAYHCIELLPLADRLAADGLPSAFVVGDHWWPTVAPALATCPHPIHDVPAAGGWLAGIAALVVMNDWDAQLVPLLDQAAAYGVATIAKVEGAQDFGDVDVPFERRPYRRAEHVLCQGRNDVEALGGRRTHIVGSTRLERLLSEAPRPVPERRLAVINLNFTHGVLEDARERFVRSAMDACAAVGIEPVVSAHPHQREGLDGLPLADRPMSELLVDASVLISRFSTVPFEAMARGVPFVYHNPHGERVPTFTEPHGAFWTSSDTDSLVAAVREALDHVGDYRARCGSFLHAQVDVDPQAPPDARAARVITALVAHTRR